MGCEVENRVMRGFEGLKIVHRLIFFHHFHFHISMAHGPPSEKLISPNQFHFLHTHTYAHTTYFPTNRKAKSQQKLFPSLSDTKTFSIKYYFVQ